MSSTIQGNVCPRCGSSASRLALNYVADHERFHDAPGQWYVDCAECWERFKEQESEPDYHVYAADFMTAAAVTALDEHLAAKFWYTETVQARMRSVVRSVLSATEREALDATPWPVPNGRDAALEMFHRLDVMRKATGEARSFEVRTMAERIEGWDELRNRIEGVGESSFPEHARQLSELWTVAPEWLRTQLQKVDDRGVEAILRAFARQERTDSSE